MKEYYVLLYREKGRAYEVLYTRETKAELVQKVSRQIEDDILDGLDYEYKIEFRREEGEFTTLGKRVKDVVISKVEGNYVS